LSTCNLNLPSVYQAAMNAGYRELVTT